MRKHSDAYTLVLLGGGFVLTWIFRSIYEDAFKKWFVQRLAQAGYGDAATEFMSSLAEFIPSLTLAGLIVYGLHWYIRRVFAAMTHREENVFAKESNLSHFVRRRDRFTIAEAACLLAQADIRQEDVVGPASGYLHDIKKRLIDGKLKALNDNGSELAIARAFSSLGGAQREIRNSLEISKDALTKLSSEFGVEISGIDAGPVMTARPATLDTSKAPRRATS